MCGPGTGKTRWHRWCGSRHDGSRPASRSRRCGLACQTGPQFARWAPSRPTSRTPSRPRWRRPGPMTGPSPGRDRHGWRLRHRQVAHARLSGRGRATAGFRGQPGRRQQGDPAVTSRPRARRRAPRCRVAGPAGRPDRRLRSRPARTPRGAWTHWKSRSARPSPPSRRSSPPACSCCAEHPRHPKMLHRIARFWAGVKVGMPDDPPGAGGRRSRQGIFAQGGARCRADRAAHAVRPAAVPRGWLCRLVHPAR